MDMNRLEDVSRYLGNPGQMYGAERFVCDEGKNKGSTVYEVRTGGGLSYKVMADTAMDIGELYYKGINMHYLTKNGHQSPDRFHPFASEFFYSFPGGMLYTCGLLSAGDGNEDGGFWHPIHGRVHAIPAQQCSSEIVDGKIVLKGQVRDTRYSGHCLQLDRTISAPVGQAFVELCDRLTNCTPEDEEYMIIYHMNFGYPFLSPALKAELPEGSEVLRLSDWAKENAGKEAGAGKSR